jgi:hypothetical protein
VNQDKCDGAGGCTDNGFKSSTAACGSQTDTACDNPNTCSGTNATCVPNYEPATTTCRAVAGSCDVAEKCDGVGSCPTDVVSPATTICRAKNGDCDDAERCTGTSTSCPADTGNQCNFRNDPQIAPTATTCEDYRNRSSQTLSLVEYLRRGNQPITSVNPGVFFLYDGVNLGVAGTITVDESDGAWTRGIGVHQGQIILYTLGCVKVSGVTVSSNADGDVTITGVPAGTYFLSVKYNPGSLVDCTTANCPNPSATYTFDVTAGGAASGSASMEVRQKHGN